MSNAIRYAVMTGVVLAAACGRTDDGRVVVETPGDVDVSKKRDTVALPRVDLPNVDIGTRKDTIIINRPTIRRDTGARDSTRR